MSAIRRSTAAIQSPEVPAQGPVTGIDSLYSFDLPIDFYATVSVEFSGSLQTSARLSVDGRPFEERTTNQNPALQRSYMEIPSNTGVLPQHCTVDVTFPSNSPVLLTVPQIDAANQAGLCRVIRYAVLAFTGNTPIAEQTTYITIVLQADLGFIPNMSSGDDQGT